LGVFPDSFVEAFGRKINLQPSSDLTFASLSSLLASLPRRERYWSGGNLLPSASKPRRTIQSLSAGPSIDADTRASTNVTQMLSDPFAKILQLGTITYSGEEHKRLA